MISSRRRGAVWRWRCRRRSPPTRGWQADKFKEDIEASEVLPDDKKRELYNAYGHVGGISKRERRRRRQQSIRRIPGLQRLLGIRWLLSLLVVKRGAGDRGVGIVRGILRHGQWRRLLSQSRAVGGRRPADVRPDHVPGGGLVKKGLHLRIHVHKKKNLVQTYPPASSQA